MLETVVSPGASPAFSDRSTFLNTLFSNAEPGYYFVVSTFPDKVCRSFSADETGITAALSYIDSVDTGQLHVFVSMGLFDHKIEQGRGTAKDVRGLTAFWADVDVGKNGYAASIEQAIEIVRSIPLTPTFITCSGVGVHAYWCFVEPVSVERDDDRADIIDLLLQWKVTVRAYAARGGGQVDAGTFDLARVMRIPGTQNPKTRPPSPAYIIEHNEEALYSPSDIEPILMDAPELWVTGKVAPIAMGGIEIRPSADRPQPFVLALTNDLRLRQTWERNRKDLDDQSASGYCLSLTDQLVSIGLTDEQIVHLICSWRREQGAVDKGPDWYARTIGKARQRNGMTSGIADLFESVESGEVGDREKILDGISQMVGIKVDSILQYGGAKRCTYRIVVKGDERELGSSADLLSQKRWCEVMVDFHHSMPSIKPGAWKKTTSLIVSAAEEVESGDELTEAGEASRWVADYLHDRDVHEVSPQEAWDGHKPFWIDGRIAVYSEHLFEHVNKGRRKELDRARDFYPAMRVMGAKRDRHDLRSKRAGGRNEPYFILPTGFGGRTQGEDYK